MSASGHFDLAEPQRHAGDAIPASVRRVLATPGRPAAPALSRAALQGIGRPGGSVRTALTPLLPTVRLHTDELAARSADDLHAAAYTVGRRIVFGRGRFAPGTAEGDRLIVHELTHVVQQRLVPETSPATAIGLASHDAREIQARASASGTPEAGSGLTAATATATVMRADPDAVAQVGKLGTAIGSAIRFVPATVTDTRIGPVSAQPGLLNTGTSRLSVIIGPELTPRILARQILPLWTTATPFTSPGGGAPVVPGPLTEDQLAQALLVYNRFFLVLPSMTPWAAGLAFPLPVDIDEPTGIATVNPDLIRLLAGSFDPAWTAALEQRAARTPTPSAATVQADAVTFLTGHASDTERGTALAARALTNAQAALPLVRAVFARLGAGGFDVALAFMDVIVNRSVSQLASQRDGAGVLAEIRSALAAVPVVPTADQTAALTRATAMLARAVAAVAAAAPAPRSTRPEKTVVVDTVKLDGSAFTPATQVAVANAIYAQTNVRIAHGVDATASPAQTTGWLGPDRALATAPACGAVSGEERALYRGAAAAFGLGARMRAFFVRDLTGYVASGYSLPPFCATGPAAPFRNHIVVQNSGDTSTLAHELGHILLNSGAHPAGTLMEPRPRPNEITDPQSLTIYNNA